MSIGNEEMVEGTKKYFAIKVLAICNHTIFF